MTVPSQTSRDSQAGNGVTLAFTVPFRILDQTHIRVLLTVGGVTTEQALTTNYTVSNVGEASTTVTFLVAPSNISTITFLRNVPFTQETDYVPNDPFPAESHERALDKLTMEVQQLNEVGGENGRTIKIPAQVTGVSTALPVPVASGLWGWDAAGTAPRYFTIPEIGTAVAFANFRYDTFTASAAQTDFTLAADPGALGNLDVSVDGVTQVPGTDYSYLGTTLTFAVAMAGGEKVLARYGTAAPVVDAATTTYTPAGTGATQRTMQDKLRERVSVEDFGAVGDGVTDDREPVRRALDYLASVGGGEVIFPRGRYRFSAPAGSQIDVSSNITLRGDGDAVIYFDDDPAVAVDPASTNRAFHVSDTENVTFDGITFEGTVLLYPNNTNNKQLLGGVRNTNLKFRHCTFRNLRHMAMGFGGTNIARVEDCTFDTIGRDGARFTHSHAVAIVGNNFRNVSDDAVALHSSDTSYPTIPAPSGHAVVGNVFEDSDGVRVLGAKGLTISGNTFRRPRNHAVHVEQGYTSTEGNTPEFAINISGNTITDALRLNVAGSTPIAVINVISAARDDNGLAQQPGVSTIPYAYNYVNNTDAGGVVNPGMFGITIANNIIARTLPNVAAYSDWGYGDLFDHRNPVDFWDDPAITDTDFGFYGIYVKGPADAVLITGNQISGLSNGFQAIRFDVNGTTNVVDLGDVVVSNNIIRDCPAGGVFASFTGSGGAARALVVQNNVFDLDPFFRNTDHAADNTWTSISTCRAVTISSGASLVMTGNTLKHMGQPNSIGAGASQYFGNFIWADPTAAGNNASNKGVRVVDETQVCIVYNADPTSGTFGQVTTTPSAAANAMPSTGKYVQGYVVRRTLPTVAGGGGSQYVVTGWIRLTTGTGHVLNTDWAEMRTLTGT